MNIVAETEIFQRYVTAIWSEAEYSAFVSWIAENPLAGDVIPGSGSCRKVRWGRAGKGQRGGARVIYCPILGQFYWPLTVDQFLWSAELELCAVFRR